MFKSLIINLKEDQKYCKNSNAVIILNNIFQF